MIQESKRFLSHNIVNNEVSTCVWNIDDNPCDGNFHNRQLFKKQLTIPVCDKHYLGHIMLMCINNKKIFDIDIEALVESESWARDELFKSKFNSSSFTTPVCRDIYFKLNNHDSTNLTDDEVIEKILEELA